MLNNVLVTIFDTNLVAAVFDFILTFLALAALNLFIDYFVKRKFVWISLAASSLVYLIAEIFIMNYIAWLSLGAIVIVTIISIFINLTEFRTLFANKFNRMKIIRKKKTTLEVDEPYATSDLYDIINTSVLYLSQYKIGALLSFVRNDNLTEVCEDGNNGVILKAPVNAELIETIFYKGTRLHDGAVIIKGNVIYAVIEQRLRFLLNTIV